MPCYRILAMIRAEQIVTTPLVDNPGVLPFRLGYVKFIKSEHVFLHYYQLDKIRDSVENIEGYLNSYIEYVKSSDPLYFSETLLVTNQVLMNMLNTINNKLNSLSMHTKQKRGLINGLGSIIKGISGNLDNDDAIRYNKALHILQSNQDSLKNQLNSGISLNKQMLKTFNVTLSTIVSNEYRIHVKLNEIMSTVNMTNYRLTDFIKINGLFNLLKINLQNILNCVTSLENALSFAKLSVTHHSVVSAEDIHFMSYVLQNIYKSSELLLDSNTEVRDYFDVIVCGSYFVDNMIVFVLKFPIMHSNTYTYYHLYPTPTLNNTILIPPKPYLAMDDSSHRYMDGECKKFHKNYYCEENSILMSSNMDDCIYQIILKQQINRSCRYSEYKAESEILQKLDDKYYILYYPKQTRIQLRCDHDVSLSLRGTYLVEVPDGCNFSTSRHQIVNVKNELKGTPMKLLFFQIQNATIKNKEQPLMLENVQLDDMYKLENLVEKETNLHLEDWQDHSYHFWTAPIYIIIVLAAFIYIFYRYKMKTGNNQPRVEQAVAFSGGAQPFFSEEQRASN